MNRKRMIAGFSAAALALLGLVGIVVYVGGAEERASSGEKMASVFIVQQRVPAGTSADRIETYIEADTVPQKLINDRTVGDLNDIDGLVAEVQLLPGETLSIDRFVEPTVFEREVDRVVDVPDGLQEVTLALSPDRAAGGQLVPGDRVGAFISFDPFSVSSEVPIEIDGSIVPPNGNTSSTTFGALHKLLVTNVQLEELPEVEQRAGLGDEEDREIRLVPSGNLLITVAIDTATAERLIFGAEFGTIWLSSEPDGATETPSQIQTRATIYDDVLADELLPIDSEQ